MTSHVSDRFVQGLFIGYVSDIEVDSNNLTRSGYITPAVDFSQTAGSSCHHHNQGRPGKCQSEEADDGYRRRRIEDYETKDYYDSVSLFVCFLPSMQSCLPASDLCTASRPNLLVIVTASFGFMRGQKEGMFVGCSVRSSGRSVLGRSLLDSTCCSLQ